MIKKAGLVVLTICLLLVLLGPGLAQASNGLSVLKNSVDMSFPLKVSFSLSAQSDVNITDIRLHYHVERMAHAQVTSEIYLKFTPASLVEVDWDWDMRKGGGLPPGARIEYWWTVADAAGNKIATKPEIARFDDLRYNWRSLTSGKVTLYWYNGDDSFANELMTAAEQGLVRVTDFTGAEPEQPVTIYIYANPSDLLGSMIFPQEWTGGVTFTEYSIVAIGIAPNMLDWGVRTIAHELTHLVIHQVTFSPYGGLPAWLDEGLAMNAEGEMDPAYAKILRSAVADNKLISVRSLASPFSAYAEEAYLAYAQSDSLVNFLVESYGQGKMFELLNIFKQGSSYDEALVKVYGFDMDGLDALWRQHVSPANSSFRMAERVWISSLAIGLLATTARYS